MINSRGLDIIEKCEKLRLKAHHGIHDPDGIFYIGYGHIITGYEKMHILKVHQTKREASLTLEEAGKLLEEDLKAAEAYLVLNTGKELKKLLSEDKWSALICLILGIGNAAFKKSATLRRLTDDTVPLVPYTFKEYVRRRGAVDKALVKRRAAEMALFKQDYDMLDRILNTSNLAGDKIAWKYLGMETLPHD